MGCCASTPSSVDSANLPAHASSRNITAPSTRRASHASQPHPHNDRPNAPLKRIPSRHRAQLPTAVPTAAAASSPSSPSNAARAPFPADPSHAAWTPSRLAKERTDWWDTQVSGRADIWGAVRLAAQFLQAGEVQEAQTMLDVSGCTCPTGWLWRGVYDVTGVQYVVPEWVVVMPDGLAGEEGEEEEEAGGVGTAASLAQADGGGDDARAGEVVTIRVRLSQGSHDIRLCVGTNDPVSRIAAAIRNKAKLDPATAHLRLVYGGRLYHDHETLGSHPYWSFDNDYVLTALVTQL